MSLENDPSGRIESQNTNSSSESAGSELVREYANTATSEQSAISQQSTAAASSSADRFLSKLEITGLGAQAGKSDSSAGAAQQQRYADAGAGAAATVSDASGRGGGTSKVDELLKNSRELLAQMEAPGMVHGLKHGHNISDSVNDPKHDNYRQELLKETKRQYEEAQKTNPKEYPELKFKEEGGKITEITKPNSWSSHFDKTLYSAPKDAAAQPGSTAQQSQPQAGDKAQSTKPDEKSKRPRLGKPTGVSAQDWLEIEPFVSQ